MRRKGYLNCRNHGSTELRSYGNGQEYTEGDLGVLLIRVCAANKTKGELTVTVNASFAGITEIRG